MKIVPLLCVNPIYLKETIPEKIVWLKWPILTSDGFLEPSKIAASRHCAEGRSPDKAIQKWALSLDCHGLSGLAMTSLGKIVS